MTKLTSEGSETSDDFRVILQLVDAALTDMTHREPKVCFSIYALDFHFDDYMISLDCETKTGEASAQGQAKALATRAKIIAKREGRW